MPARLRKLPCPPEPQGRIVLTPGRLYFLMSQELRAARRGRSCRCSLPMLHALPGDRTGGPNWDVEAFTFQCEPCRDVALGILARHRRRYDVDRLELPPAAPNRLPTEVESLLFEDRAWLFGYWGGTGTGHARSPLP